ncbi:hypothetical protein BGX23_007139 [Mortierella sp. AD031]|nr:hypothetical protein BGX23_007139 [Mortierella sp. AD031]
MCHLEPEFVDITWGAGGSRPAATLEVVSNVQKVLGVETCMHLICTDNPVHKIDKALQEARACGNQNILALRGDPPHGQSTWSACEGGLAYASELVKHIRQTHGEYFGIGVAAYPELHPESTSLAQDLFHLKQKVDAGADFIVTQLFFDVPLFLNWVEEVRRAGITCPIVPGLMPIQTYAGFKKNVMDIGLSVPRWIMEGLEAVKEDEQAVKAFGVQVGIQMTKELLESGLVPGIHYYTFNLERSTRLILEGAGLVPSQQQSSTTNVENGSNNNSVASTSTASPPQPVSSPSLSLSPTVITKDKPWRSNFLPHRRRQELQRPIFWANRPKSYISRTETWQDFPADGSQWCNAINNNTDESSSSSLKPTPPREFGSLDGYGVSLKCSTADEARAHWGGQPCRLEDLSEIFQKHWRGELQTLPWCDHQPLGCSDRGGSVYRERLVELNRAGYLTINSQPVVNGAKSDDKVVGWGPPGGYVYQKAFLEFFVSPKKLSILQERLTTRFPNYTYNAINRSGILHTNTNTRTITRSKTRQQSRQKRQRLGEHEHEHNTVTWGVFPGQEIVQPTIVESSCFEAWKDEAFALWDQWSCCFESEGSQSEEEEGSSKAKATRRLLGEIRDGWFLMNVVNDDYHEPNGAFDLFTEDLVKAKVEVEVKVEKATKKSKVEQVVVEEKAVKSVEDAGVFSNAVALAVVASAAAAVTVASGTVAEVNFSA